MRDLAGTMQRLRLVKQARGKFLGLWAAECIFEQKRPLSRVVRDVREARMPARMRKIVEG